MHSMNINNAHVKALSKLVASIIVCMSISLEIAFCENSEPYLTTHAKPYIESQKFTGRAFYKDNNAWIYTPAFAKTFGMRSEGVSTQLKGAEAVAFRIEDDGFLLCGLGGKIENCKEMPQCMMDVYINENKFPLPWASNKQSEWHPFFTSIRWLAASKPPSTMKIDSFYATEATLYPFIDPETHEKVYVGHDGHQPKDTLNAFSESLVFGYMRNAVEGLTMVTLRYGCERKNLDRPYRTFSFQSYDSTKNNDIPLNKFHEFRLPITFERKIDELVQSQDNKDRDIYRSILNQKNQASE